MEKKREKIKGSESIRRVALAFIACAFSFFISSVVYAETQSGPVVLNMDALKVTLTDITIPETIHFRRTGNRDSNLTAEYIYDGNATPQETFTIINNGETGVEVADISFEVGDGWRLAGFTGEFRSSDRKTIGVLCVAGTEVHDFAEGSFAPSFTVDAMDSDTLVFYGRTGYFTESVTDNIGEITITFSLV